MDHEKENDSSDLSQEHAGSGTSEVKVSNAEWRVANHQKVRS